MIPAVVDELRYSGFSIYQHVEEGADGRVHHYTLIKEDIESPTPLNGMTYRIIRDGKPWILIEDGEQGLLVRQDVYYPSFKDKFLNSIPGQVWGWMRGVRFLKDGENVDIILDRLLEGNNEISLSQAREEENPRYMSAENGKR